jgi:hypothetical protein
MNELRAGRGFDKDCVRSVLSRNQESRWNLFLISDNFHYHIFTVNQKKYRYSV